MKQLGRDYIIAINDVDPQKVISIKHSPPITEDLRQNILREVQLCSCQITPLAISKCKIVITLVLDFMWQGNGDMS